MHMNNNTLHIWMWMYNNRLYKAVSNPVEGTFTIYDDHENIMIKRTGLTPAQLKKIEFVLKSADGKCLKQQPSIT